MKRIIATALVAVMILSALAALAVVPASAASGDEGDWAVYARAGEYGTDTSGNIDYSTIPTDTLPGYWYDDEGLHVTGDYNNSMGQRFNIMTKNEVNIKDGVTMKVRVDEFRYGGDMWFSFVIHDKPMVSQSGDPATFGQGYWSLIRTQYSKQGVSFTQMQSFVSSTTYYDTTKSDTNPGIWGIYNGGSATSPTTGNMFGSGDATDTGGFIGGENGPKFAEDGSVELTFKLVYDIVENTYKLNICGVEVNSAILTDYLNWDFSDGMAYIGFSVHSSLSDATASVTVTEFNGEIPSGTDSREKANYSEVIAPIPNPDGIEEGQPCLLFDANNAKGEFRGESNDPANARFSSVKDFEYKGNKDGTFTLTARDGAAPFVTVFPKKSVSYEAANYPYVGVLVRNFCNCVLNPSQTLEDCQGLGEKITMYYMAGENNGANDTILADSGMAVYNEISSIDGHNYKYFILDLSESDWKGRIHGIQLVFNGMQMANSTQKQLTFCFSAFFDSEAAAEDYGRNYIDTVEVCEHADVETIPGKEATCTNTGATEGKHCKDCGLWVQPIEPIPALEHEIIVADAVEPTCQSIGYQTGEKCKNCDFTHQETIAKVDHKYLNTWATDADSHWHACEFGCGTKKDEGEHTEGETCTICGYGCSHANTSEVIGKNPTCSEYGVKYIHCDDCNTDIDYENINKLPHTPVAIPAVAPTCTKTGLTEGQRCSECNTITTPQTTVDMAEHTSSDVPAVDPTCTVDGHTAYTKCSVCEKVLTQPQVVNKTGHTWDDDKDTTCNVCGEEREISNNSGTSSGGSQTQKPSDNKPEEKEGCKSIVGFSALAVCATVALAGAMCFKKKKD